MIDKMTRALTVAIQAGGKSARMGTDKAFALLDGKPLIEHVLDKVRRIDPAEILIVTRTPERYAAYEGVSVIEDSADKGALGGLFAAFRKAQHPNVLMVGCDMPFLNPALLAFIGDMQQAPPYCAIVPRWEEQAEGLHALYHRSSIWAVRLHLNNGRLSLQGMLEDLASWRIRLESSDGELRDSGVRWLDALEYAHLDAEGRSFTNINTPDELRAAQQRSS